MNTVKLFMLFILCINFMHPSYNWQNLKEMKGLEFIEDKLFDGINKFFANKNSSEKNKFDETTVNEIEKILNNSESYLTKMTNVVSNLTTYFYKDDKKEKMIQEIKLALKKIQANYFLISKKEFDSIEKELSTQLKMQSKEKVYAISLNTIVNCIKNNKITVKIIFFILKILNNSYSDINKISVKKNYIKAYLINELIKIKSNKNDLNSLLENLLRNNNSLLSFSQIQTIYKEALQNNTDHNVTPHFIALSFQKKNEQSSDKKLLELHTLQIEESITDFFLIIEHMAKQKQYNLDTFDGENEFNKDFLNLISLFLYAQTNEIRNPDNTDLFEFAQYLYTQKYLTEKEIKTTEITTEKEQTIKPFLQKTELIAEEKEIISNKIPIPVESPIKEQKKIETATKKLTTKEITKPTEKEKSLSQEKTTVKGTTNNSSKNKKSNKKGKSKNKKSKRKKRR